MPRTPKLPKLLDRKIYKTGQTRGADDDVIYQNRVLRTSTVLIPYILWDEVSAPPADETNFENGFIALLTPTDYFESPNIQAELQTRNLSLGQNALVFYQMRVDWEAHNPEAMGWTPAEQREAPLRGEYVARIAGTTSVDQGERINRGYTTTGKKGAGIRLFEYAPPNSIAQCRTQLESIFWLCCDSMDAVTEFGMRAEDALARKEFCLNKARDAGLLDINQMQQARMVDGDEETVCPLCLEKLSSYGFFNRLAQAMGREVHDLTVTEINLFHIEELRYGLYNHRPYNLGWGHHHCNVVVKDAGLVDTIKWMDEVVQRNSLYGFYSP